MGGGEKEKEKEEKGKRREGKYEYLGIKRDKAKNLAQQDRTMATK